ncbi:hypothetical protein A9798_00380 [Edwardsiella hoshinae]|uniref:Uncharacterized protein n=1 Tax=Edwardsiella hoshinae TaxID=93378 RepID=A0ABM6EF78_9GAMM|nr:hypothetical protein [Edwardsiella hoshinae]AOV95548.1 hypothetical protein A9798_00380 [Edwardsiella hoshinae]
MKKTVIALALATAGLSGVAQAAAPTWAEWSGPKTYQISGTITPQTGQNIWSWAVGDGLTNLNATLIKSTGNKLSIPLVKDTPILLGKTNSPLKVATLADAAGLSPSISFTDMDGGHVELQAAPGGIAWGAAYLDLPVKNSSNEKIGTARLTVITAGIEINANSVETYKYSLYATNAGDVFFGGVLQNNSLIAQTASLADNTIQQFGGFTLDEMIAQIRPVLSNANVKEGNSIRGNLNAQYNYAFSYAMGMTTNNPIELTLTNKPTAITEWKAPLTIAVSYN